MQTKLDAYKRNESQIKFYFFYSKHLYIKNKQNISLKYIINFLVTNFEVNKYEYIFCNYNNHLPFQL